MASTTQKIFKNNKILRKRAQTPTLKSAMKTNLWCVGSSTDTVAFQVYEILKIDHEFLQFF